MEAVCKTDSDGVYGAITAGGPHESIRGDDLAEPSSRKGVNMLEALPDFEQEFYGTESNVVELPGKSDLEYQQIVKRYCFFGGSLEEYVKYWARGDVQDFWEFRRGDRVKSVQGFTAVAKKAQPRDPPGASPQRKILACNPCNYWWVPAQ